MVWKMKMGGLAATGPPRGLVKEQPQAPVHT